MWILGGKGVGSGERNREIGTDTYSLLIPSVKYIRASLVYQIVKNMPAMQEPQVGSLGQEDPLEKGIEGCLLQHSCLENSTDEGLTVHGVTESDTTEHAHRVHS